MNAPRISDSEWEVMKAVWDQEPLTAVEVLKLLPHDQWKQKTVNTFLTRLEAKGVIRSERVGRANVYRSLMSEEACRGNGRESVSEESFPRRGGSSDAAFHRERRSLGRRYSRVEAIAGKEGSIRWLTFSGHTGMYPSALAC